MTDWFTMNEENRFPAVDRLPQVMKEKIPQYTIGLTTKNQDQFFIYSQECTDSPRPADTAPHSHHYYSLSFLYEGQAQDPVDLTRHTLQSPALFILNVDQVHIHSDLTGCKMISIAFSPEFLYGQERKLRGYTETVFSRTSMALARAELEELDRYIQLLLAHDQGAGKDPEVIRCLLNIILIKCAGFMKDPDNSRSRIRHPAHHFQELLKENFRNNHQVKFYAEVLHITPSVLVKNVKNEYHKTPKEMIDDRLMTEAKRLLYWSDLTIREIAWELGFETDSYFNRFFKKFTGKTPKAFQKEMLVNKML